MNGSESNGTDIYMKWKMECSINETKPSWIEHFIFHQMKISVLLHKWKTFIICFI